MGAPRRVEEGKAQRLCEHAGLRRGIGTPSAKRSVHLQNHVGYRLVATGAQRANLTFYFWTSHIGNRKPGGPRRRGFCAQRPEVPFLLSAY